MTKKYQNTDDLNAKPNASEVSCAGSVETERGAQEADILGASGQVSVCLHASMSLQDSFDVLEAFEKSVHQDPHAPAVSCGLDSVTRMELDVRSSAIAEHLRKSGVLPGDLVAVDVQKSIFQIEVVLGVLKTGAAYLPLDPSFPLQRVQAIVEDSGARLLLSDRADLPPESPFLREIVSALCSARAFERKGTCPKSFPSVLSSDGDPAHSLAYVIYTSGSTGEPKGVAVSRQCLNHLAQAFLAVHALTSGDAILAMASLAFDMHIPDIWVALSVGARIVIPRDAERLDGKLLGQLMLSQDVSFVQCTPSAWRILLDSGWEGKKGLIAIAAGEPLPRELAQELLQRVDKLWNGYGPTETTVYTTFWEVNREEIERAVYIGQNLPGTWIAVVDENFVPVPEGAEGQILIGGWGVTPGYLNRPALTAKSFRSLADAPDLHRLICAQNPDFSVLGFYCSGDRGRLSKDLRGELQLTCLGRVDQQVKVRGFRIELGEIERILETSEGVQRAVVRALALPSGEKGIVAHIQLNRDHFFLEDQQAQKMETLRKELEERLPDYMVPAFLVPVERFSLTPNGKVDTSKLKNPWESLPKEVSTSAGSVREKGSVSIIEEIWKETLGMPAQSPVSSSDHFFRNGGSSLLAARFFSKLKGRLNGFEKSGPLLLFRHPRFGDLVQALESCQGFSGEEKCASARRTSGENSGERIRGSALPLNKGKNQDRRRAVAVVGFDVRLPGARDVFAFWEMLLNQRSGIRRFSGDSLDPSQNPEDESYVSARGVVHGGDAIDVGFFGLTRREAALMDPQQRIFVEVVWNAFEFAGLDPERITEKVGVFAGVYTNTWLTHVLRRSWSQVESFGEFPTSLLNDKDYVATRVAHLFNFKGPALNINTACSTGLVALHQAVEAIRTGSCEVALAGGSALTFPMRSGYQAVEGGMLSPEGVTRPFSDNASGTVFSDGIAAVVLAEVEWARAHGLTIYGIVEGSALNNDGGEKASFSAPNPAGQAAVVKAALVDANVRAEDVSYVEAHGTATALGDPIELQALSEAFLDGRSGKLQPWCRVGSAKSNVGHITVGSGLVGLVKTCLSLHYETIPATLNFRAPTPHFDFVHSPFSVCSTLVPWVSEGSRRRFAGVSSFGVGGTNAHVILKEGDVHRTSASEPPKGNPIDSPQVIVLSAANQGALAASLARLAHWTSRHGKKGLRLRDIARTLLSGRKQDKVRYACVVSSLTELEAQLRSSLRRLENHREDVPILGTQRDGSHAPMVWCFPGQGSQVFGMGLSLYRTSVSFRETFDRISRKFSATMGIDLHDILGYQTDPSAISWSPDSVFVCSERLQQTEIAQPAIFTVSLAIAAELEALGLRPDGVIGHSIGELAAAHIAGVFTEDEGVALVSARARLMQAMPSGVMLAVNMSMEEIAPLLPDSLDIAVVNAPQSCVLAGLKGDVDTFADFLSRAHPHVACRKLSTSHAFHSRMMGEASRQLLGRASGIPFGPLKCPLFSTMDDRVYSSEDTTSRLDAGYWADQVRSPVRFDRAAELARRHFQGHAPVFLEVGPKGGLTGFLKKTRADAVAWSVISTPAPRSGDGDRESAFQVYSSQDRELRSYLNFLGQLWCEGLISANKLSERLQLTRSGARCVGIPGRLFESEICRVIPDDWRAAFAAEENLMTIMNDELFRGTRLRLQELIADESGLLPEEVSADVSFISLGLDSLLLTQLALKLKSVFRVPVRFRQLMDELGDVSRLSAHLVQEMPDEVKKILISEVAKPQKVGSGEGVAPPITPQTSVESVRAPSPQASAQPVSSGLAGTIQAQIELMQLQMRVLLGQTHDVSVQSFSGLAPASAAVQSDRNECQQSGPHGEDARVKPAVQESEENAEKPKAFGAIARITLEKETGFSASEHQAMQDFFSKYVSKTARSKAHTEKYRQVLADPRVVTGFKPHLKEVTYQPIVERSKGSRIWDIDGNEYIDCLNGFGMNLFGWSPDFITEALVAQMRTSMDIGPMTPLAGRAAEKIARMTGMERVGFCNTGSEAVLGCVRIARTRTGRSKIVSFAGSYHGIFDEVLTRPLGRNTGRSASAAPGILGNAGENIYILEYGSPDSLAFMREHADDIAGVLCEPIQSRNADLQPREFLHELRDLTLEHDMALIFDEVITGFRLAPGGAQEHFGIAADLTAYGKVVGGGMPIGVIAGRNGWADPLDGGLWRFGDDSQPEVGVTYFAGTFVRHPPALRAALAVLDKLEEAGPALQRDLNAKTQGLVRRLNAFFLEENLSFKVATMGSLWRCTYGPDIRTGDLFFIWLRLNGLHIWDGFPCFLTTAHSDADIEKIEQTIKSTVREMQAAGLLPKPAGDRVFPGRDVDGKPARFHLEQHLPARFVLAENETEDS